VRFLQVIAAAGLALVCGVCLAEPPSAVGEKPSNAAVVAPPPGATLPRLPVELSAKDQERLAGFDDNRASAIALANQKADSQRDRDDLAAVAAGSGMAMTQKDLVGEWRCRSLQLDSLGLFIYDYFKCRISARGDALVFQKTTGSQRTKGRLYRLSDTRYVYAGAATVNDDPPVEYGARPDSDEVGYLVRTGTNRLRMEFPRGTYQHGTAFEILDLRK
jgi:hypothetical protein